MGLSSNNPVVLTVVTAGTSFSRTFSVKITQIECDTLAKGDNRYFKQIQYNCYNAAGDGCLQHYTGVAGTIESFNYNNGAGLQLSDTDYTVCVRMERNFCGIQYSACADNTATVAAAPGQPAVSVQPRAFSISGTAGQTGTSVSDVCNKDWLTIPCATNTNSGSNAQSGSPAVCVDRICGQVFDSVTNPFNPTLEARPVYSYSKPFNIYVHTDSTEGSGSPPESLNRGFCLNFVQQPCTSSTG